MNTSFSKIRHIQEANRQLEKRVLNEQSPKDGDNVTVDKLPKEIQDFIKTYGLTGTFDYISVNTFGYDKNNLYTRISVEEIKSYEQNKGNIGKCDEREQKRKEIVNKLQNSIRDPQELQKQVQSELGKLYPNMEYCFVVRKVQNIINLK